MLGADKPQRGRAGKMKNPSPLQKWLATKGIVTGLCLGLPVLAMLMIFGVNVFTLFALFVCGGLIIAGILAFPGAAKPTHVTGGVRDPSDQSRNTTNAGEG